MEPVLKMIKICKYFPGVVANENINLDCYKGEVHALLGENGAGKSTLMSVLCGLYKPSSGTIKIDGKEVSFASAKDAMKIGIGMVHQHFMLIPRFTVAENCLIGYGERNAGKLKLKETVKKIREISQKYGMPIDPNATVEKLSVGERQRVEIIKAIFRGARILILDEPTAVLTPQETGELIQMIRNLVSHGFTVLFISHKLNEIKEISDRVTVLRLGRVMGTYKTEDCSVDDLARLMVGREVNFGVEKKENHFRKEVLCVNKMYLEGKDDTSKRVLDDISFSIRAGEIVGVAGVDGNGQAELVECLTGMHKNVGGTAEFLPGGIDLLKSSTRQIMKSGVSHIPQDRQETGLVMQMPLYENFILQDYYVTKFGRGKFLNWKVVNQYADDAIRAFGVKTPDNKELAQNLSGGNQQKVVVARELLRNPKLLIAMHPTRGVDVGAIEYIHKKIIEQKENNVGVLLVSTELDEVVKLSDRICVMFEGRIMGIVNTSETTIEEIGLMMGGMTLDKLQKQKKEKGRSED
ncbi:MAG: ABC transporter ATP-binding protein [Roseburia sp.]|nr:ABC transporter ATP-binding protein [Roseburia sp.]